MTAPFAAPTRALAPATYDCILLAGFGGPEGQDDVIPYLRNVTRGRGIPDERLEEVAHHYRHFGGISPINDQNRALKAFPAINAEIQRKLAAEQDLERMDRERQIAEQEARIMVTTARGRAAAQRIVNETLTPLYVQHEMLEQFRALARTSRATIIVAPTTTNGSSPVILSLPQAGGGAAPAAQ